MKQINNHIDIQSEPPVVAQVIVCNEWAFEPKRLIRRVYTANGHLLASYDWFMYSDKQDEFAFGSADSTKPEGLNIDIK